MIPQQPNDEEDDILIPYPIVYLQDEETFGIMVSYGAFVSRVKYWKDGISYEVVVENEDIMDGD